ncbi:MAG: hypothetical protein ACFFE8_14950 [Candidatus Heimdallarchaeota archaeon]
MGLENWSKIVGDAFHVIKEDFRTSEVKNLVLARMGDSYNKTAFSRDESDIDIWAGLLLQGWGLITQILSNELQLDTWHTISIKSRKHSVTIFSIGAEFAPTLLLLLLHDVTFDPLDIMKLLLKQIFHKGYSDKYQIVGLIASAGFPVWVAYPEGREMDDFLFAISITSLLSLVERIDMEVKAGGVENCVIQGDEHLALNVAFNPSQDLALAVTQHNTELEDIGLEEELMSFYRKIVDPVLYGVNVPEIIDEERERILEEIQQEFEGDITEEEIQSLSAFDTETLASLENEIKMVIEKYHVDELSIGYLRRRLKLPREVLAMALEYLIANNQIDGRIGTKAGKQVLAIFQRSQINELEQAQINDVQQQIKDLFLPLKPYIRELPALDEGRPKPRESISDALSEFQVLVTLSDTDPVFLQIDDIKITHGQLKNSVKALRLLEQQILETEGDHLLQSQLGIRKQSLIKKNATLYLKVHQKARSLYNDLVNNYRLLYRLLPIPNYFTSNRDCETPIIGFRCAGHKCSSALEIFDDSPIWITLQSLSQQFQFYDPFYDIDTSVEEITALATHLTDLLQKLEQFVKEAEEPNPHDELLFLEHINDLVIPNSARDSAINKLRHSMARKDRVHNYFSEFDQCKRCQRWYCRSESHMGSPSRCIYCA